MHSCKRAEHDTPGLCREGKFAQQQQVATKLQRLSGPEEPYIWWTICSLILQARAAVQGNSHLICWHCSQAWSAPGLPLAYECTR